MFIQGKLNSRGKREQETPYLEKWLALSAEGKGRNVWELYR